MDSENVIKNTEMLGGNWAAHEVALACEHEHPGWNGKQLDYGCACYLAALDAIKAIKQYEPTIFQAGHIARAFDRLISHKPLAPITEKDFEGIEPSRDGWDEEHHLSSIQCPRYSALFKSIYDDGRVEYHDVDMTLCINAENRNDTFHNGFVNNFVCEMFPIKLPYYPALKPYEVVVSQWPVNYPDHVPGTEWDAEVLMIHTIKEPDGTMHNLDRIWVFNGKEPAREVYQEDEIKQLHDQRAVSRIDDYVSTLLDSIKDAADDMWQGKWIKEYGPKFFIWSLDEDDPRWNDFRKYRWDFIWSRLIRNNPYKVSDELEKKLVKACGVMLTERVPYIWSLCNALLHDSENWLKDHPEYKDLVDVITEVKDELYKHHTKFEIPFKQLVERIDPLYESNDVDAILKIIQEYDPTFPPRSIACWFKKPDEPIEIDENVNEGKKE